MPKYSNQTNRWIGKNYLKVPIGATNFESIYYYDDADLSLIEEAPYYNPVKFKHIIDFTNMENFTVEFPFDILEEGHLVVYTKCDNQSKFNSIEMFFNDTNNLPSLPLTNTEFEMPIFNRIKRLHFNITQTCKGQICVMIVDRYIPSKLTISAPTSP